MKNIFLLISTGILFTVLGCSGNSQNNNSKSTPAVVHASVEGASTRAAAEPAAALPVPSVGTANPKDWYSENIKDPLGNAVALKATSLDGKYDLVILQKGRYSFLSMVRHAHWESVANKAAKGKLMYLRAKFEDGKEIRIEWDELGFATENLYSVLWSYPAKLDAPIGAVPQGATTDSVGGDQLLIQEMMNHKTMILEVEPGVTTQFAMNGLKQEIEQARALKSQPVIEAMQTAK
jgi:hypothetical protein